MNTMQIFYLLLIFAAATGVAFAVIAFATGGTTKQRLQKVSGVEIERRSPNRPQWQAKLVQLASPIAKLALPNEGWEDSPLRLRFINAGHRANSAPALFFAAKAILTFALPGLFILYVSLSGANVRATMLLLGLLVLAAIGYYLPNAVLQNQIRLRQRGIFEALPDALDLMTVSVEAGLGLDAAIAKVGDEMRLTSPELSDEFHLANLELRAGSSRERALRNLALRTGVEEVDALVTMLVQADRFGTSVADSLRIHSDHLRTKRRLRAEEAAAKIPLKLLFPLIFFIFPSLLLVLLGPAFISIVRVLLPTMTGH